MWRPDHELLAKQLTSHFGIGLEARALPARGSYPAFELLPVDCHKNEAFRLVVEIKWRSLEMQFRPGPFAGELVAQMGLAPPPRVETFVRLAEKCVSEKAAVSLVVNSAARHIAHPSSWPAEWQRVTIGLTKSPAIVNTEDDAANDAELLKWARRFAGLIFALVPLEEEEIEISNVDGLPEGAVTRIEVNRYERSRVNRDACIQLQGASCKACDFSFLETYGPVGEGYIEVHHVTPVSELGPGYVVNPLADLVPLCANCHSIAHRRRPPYSVDEIRELLQDR